MVAFVTPLYPFIYSHLYYPFQPAAMLYRRCRCRVYYIYTLCNATVNSVATALHATVKYLDTYLVFMLSVATALQRRCNGRHATVLQR